MIKIGRKDVYWNYAATFMKIASSALLLPFILRMMEPELVGIWVVFMTITAFSGLFDFGFGPSFTRNVTYVFSGVKKLKTKGFEVVNVEERNVDYGLLKGVIFAMRWLYIRIAILLFIILATFGTLFISSLLKSYNGSHIEIYIAWGILCIITTYNLYTLYYDSLLQGKGLIKKSKQIIIIGNTIYVFFAAFFIIWGYGLIAIIAAQALSVVIIRVLSYRAFFSKHLKEKLNYSTNFSHKEVLNAVTPNAVKVGLTSLGGFLVFRSSIIIGSLYLPLDEIAAYGITMQLILVIIGLSGIYTATYQPKIVQLRVAENLKAIKEVYLKGQIVLVITFLVGGSILIVFGGKALEIIGSQTQLIPRGLILLSVVIALLESNHSIAGSLLLTKNEVPFFKASLYSGVVTLFLLFAFFSFTDLGLASMVIAPGLAQIGYQNWKWPIMVAKELNINHNDFYIVIKNTIRRNK